VSYLVLARKYRPQRFEDLVGQEHVARTLTNAIAWVACITPSCSRARAV
jgi:DNA polymerase III gamma/tau subunit